MAKIGYARVSTEEQNLDLQLDALKEAGCEQIFKDIGISALSNNRTGFENALSALKSGDSFLIWKMDRAFRSMRHALDTLEFFEKNNIEFIALTEQIDTTTAIGKCMYHVRNAFAAMERDLISERTKAGMEAARKRGKTLGRPKRLSAKQVEQAKKELRHSPHASIKSIAKSYKVSPATLTRALAIMD